MKKRPFINKKNSAKLQMVQTRDAVEFHVSSAPQSEAAHQLALQIEKQLNAKNTKSAKAPNPDPLQPLIEDPLALVAGREDLWINQLKKQQPQPSSDQQFPVRLYDEDLRPLQPQDPSRGQQICVFKVPDEDKQRVTLDIDYNREDLDEEQREIYDALMNEEGDYEELEDDFVTQAVGGEIFAVQEIVPRPPTQLQPEIQPQKKVTFQEADEDDNEEDYEDEEEDYKEKKNQAQPKRQQEPKAPKEKQREQDKEREIEITYDKPKQREPKQYDEDEEAEEEEEDASDLEINSDMEREFQREMKNYDEDQEDQEIDGKKGEEVESGLHFHQVIDNHLMAMKQKQGKVDKALVPERKRRDLTEDEKQQQLEELKHTDYLEYLKQKFPNVDPSEFHLRREIPKIEFEEDRVLQEYINRDSTEEECPEMEEADHGEETIITRQIQESTLSKMNPEQLNIIKYQKKAPAKVGKKNDKQELIKEIQLKKETEKQQKSDLLQQLVREKNETAEEKKKRKELLKAVKKQQKEKKRQFKEATKDLGKQLVEQKAANIQSTVPEGVTVMKL